MKSPTYQYLNKYKYKQVDTRALKEKIIDLNNDIYIVCSNSVIGFEKDRNIEEYNPDTILSAKISYLLDLKEEYKRKIEENEEICKEIRVYINKEASTETTRMILERYFCDLWSFGKIAVNVGYSFPHVKKLFYDEIKRIDQKSEKQKVNTK